MKGKLSKAVAKGTVSVLNTFLRADANSASCVIAYQPKAPKELARYRRRKMMEKCANIIADWLISCKAVEEMDKELYSYAVYSILLSLSPLALAIGFGVCMGCVRQSVMIIMPFVIIRKFSGGYHTKHTWSCLIWSCLLLVLCVVLSFHIKCGWVLALITVGAAVSLICFSPIDNENRVLSQEECGCYKMITAVLVIIFMLVDALLFVCQLHIYSICISIGIMLSAGLQLPCIFKELRKMLTN